MRTTPNARTAPIIRSGSADGILEEAKRLGEPELQVFLERLTGTPMKSEQVAADPKPPAAKPAARVVKGGPDWPQFYGGPTHNNFRADENEFGATGLSTPGIMPGAILVGYGRSVAAYDARTGRRSRRPRIRCRPNAFGSPTLVGDTIDYGNLDGHLYAIGNAPGDPAPAGFILEPRQ